MESRARVEDDRELVDRSINGDGEAFRRLVEKHHARVFRLVRGILGDWHRSEDVCQEIFTAIYRKLSGFRRDARFSTWMYRVAVNAALRARKRWKTALLPLEAVEPTRLATKPSRPAFEGDEALKKLLAPLPPKLRTVVVLREQAGLSYGEIAEVLGCSRGAVEQRIHRAMTLLREVWGKRGAP